MLLNSVGTTAGVLVDSVAPVVSGNVAVPAAGTYKTGDTLSFTVVFDENVTVTGTSYTSPVCSNRTTTSCASIDVL